jgi:hypothetical protein
VGIYTIIGLLVFVLVRLAIKNSQDAASLPVGMVGEEEGGGGHPDGIGTKNPGDLDPMVTKNENISAPPGVQAPASPAVMEDLKPVVPADVTLPDLISGDRFLEIDESAQEAVKKLQGVSENARAKLMEGIAQAPGKGRGGSGRGGGKGDGDGTKDGPGRGMLEREKRILRWKMQFNTFDGRDYLTQLDELGAILAVPEPRSADAYRVIRDLKRTPAHGEIEDLKTIERIFWIDDKPESVRSLAMALGLQVPPPHIVAFFPQSLEQELADKEKKFKGRSENQIKETRYRVVRRGGKYVPEVESQR